MVEVETLQKMLEVDEKEIQALDTEKLRLLLGVARYFTRVVEREVNERDGLL